MTFILTFVLLFSQTQSARQTNHRWHAATYRGLTIGKSRRADMLRVLGQPKWSRKSPGEDNTDSRRKADSDSPREVWNNYEHAGEFHGIMNVVLDRRRDTITRIEFYPQKLSKEEAVAHFGRGYIITRYDFDRCGGDEESEPIYESPNGPLISVEYRSRGIAISVGYKDLVTKISYVSGPIGSPKSKCQ